MTVLDRYHQTFPRSFRGRTVHLKPGARGYPELPPAAPLLERYLPTLAAPVTDASGCAGLGLVAAGEDATAGGVIAEPSFAALRCARLTLEGAATEVRAALPWDLAVESCETLLLAPPGDRGSARVEAELRAAARALTPQGRLFLALHKDQGAKRYAKVAQEGFGRVETLARQGGWRLLEASGPLEAQARRAGESVPGTAEFAVGELAVRSLPGVHSARRLDPGTAVLLKEIDARELTGQDVLDLGCGSGVLALTAAAAGARTTAADDDLAAVRSTELNALANGLTLKVVHSDIDSELEAGSFDVVLTNPPFHVGRGVRLQVPEAFIAAAHQLLRPGGSMLLVANRDLPYEQMLGQWRRFERVRDENGFKVLRAWR